MRILHGERQRGAGLIAVERAVTGRIQPERALTLPHLQRVRGFAGPSAFISGAARAIVLGSRCSQIRAEAKTFLRQCDRPVRIALTGCDAIAKAGDENIAHPDLGRDLLRRIGSAGDLHGSDCGAAITRPEIDRLGAIERGLLRTFAVVERPGAGRANRNFAGQPNGDRVIHRRQVAFPDLIADAGLADAAGEIDAESAHHVARPAAAVTLRFQRLLGCENAAALRVFGMKQEVAFFTE